MRDYFQNTGHAITRINFLRYSESEWQRIAGWLLSKVVSRLENFALVSM
jgi:hypothetical protein